MGTRLHCFAGALLLLGCGGSSTPAYEEASYGPAPSATSGGNAGPAPAAADREPSLEDKIRTAELSATYEGVGDAPSPYAPQNQLATGSEAYAVADGARAVELNRMQLGEPDLKELEAILGARPGAGRYWYDARSGLWGLWGHGAGGVTRPNLRAAELPRDASGGTTAVLINGRTLTRRELDTMLALLEWPVGSEAAYAGSYTLDADGKLHKVQGRYLGNLSTKAKQARAAGKYDDRALDCALTRLGDASDVLGVGVTVNCD